MTGSPCQNCEDRHMHCHSECDKYKEFRAEVRRINRKRYKHNDVENYFIDKYIRRRNESNK